MNLHKIATRMIQTGRIKTAGEITFHKDTGPPRRDLRVTQFKWDPDTLRNLAKILWATERAHSYAMASLRLFSKMPSSEFSPDGLLGGKGYIQAIKDMRTGLSQAVEFISSFTDTLYDEINADHWATSGDKDQTEGIVEEAQAVKADPEGYVQQEFEKSTPGTKDGEFSEVINPGAKEMNPQVVNPGEEEDADEDDEVGLGWGKQSAINTTNKNKKLPKEDQASELPGTDANDYYFGKTPAEMAMHTVTPDHGSYSSVVKQAVSKLRNRVATGAIDTNTLPGPRVQHPGEGSEDPGYMTELNERPSDDPTGEGFSQYDRIYEGAEANADGVTEQYPPNLGDSSIYKQNWSTIHKISIKLASTDANTYSWLPGSNNDKNLDYYALGLSEADITWMRAHSKPDLPKGMRDKSKRPTMNSLWEIDI
jgi:hypothetical protein